MSTTTPKQFWIIAYDISDNKRRNKVAELLEQYGTRCNYSVFECLITEARFRKIQIILKKNIDSETDCILYYYLCKSCLPKKVILGKTPEILDEVVVV